MKKTDARKMESKDSLNTSMDCQSNCVKQPSKFKVVQSRYMQSASNATTRMRTNIIRVDGTPLSPRHSFNDTKSLIRTQSPNRRGSSLHTRGRSTLMVPDQTFSESILDLPSSKPQLHSTAVFSADRTQFEANTFSTTILNMPKRNSKNVANISAISKDNGIHEDSKKTKETKVVTCDDVNREYLMYLNSVYMSTAAKKATISHSKDAQYQLDFMNELIQQKMEEKIKLSKFLQLVDHYKKTLDKAERMKNSLEELKGIQKTTMDSIKNLGKGLECNLSKMKISNIHLSEDQYGYSANFQHELEENLELLERVNQKNKSSYEKSLKMSQLLNYIHLKKQFITEQQPLLEEVTSLTLEKASLKLSLHDSEENK